MSDESPTGFTAGETKFLVTMLKHTSSDIQADWDAMAQELNMKDSTSVRACWNTIRRKKILGNGANAAVTPTSSGKKRGATKAADGETPTKKRASKKSAKAAEEALPGGDEATEGKKADKIKAEEDD